VACIPNIPYIEFCTLETPLRTSVAQERIQVVDGLVEIPEAPGIGIELNRETLERYRYQPAE
jgi:D-galactarolactone cycloisomerase